MPPSGNFVLLSACSSRMAMPYRCTPLATPHSKSSKGLDLSGQRDRGRHDDSDGNNPPRLGAHQPTRALSHHAFGPQMRSGFPSRPYFAPSPQGIRSASAGFNIVVVVSPCSSGRGDERGSENRNRFSTCGPECGFDLVALAAQMSIRHALHEAVH